MLESEVLAAIASEALGVATRLIGAALQSGAITPEQADQMLADSQSQWGSAYADWKAARAQP